MRINKPAKSGTLESNDILVMIFPNEGKGIKLELESIVMKQFGDQIEKTIMDKINELGIEDILVKAQDRGALDYTIKSRVETAVKRSLN